MVKKNLTGKAAAAAAALTLTVSSLGQLAAVPGNKVSAAETDNYAKLLQASLFFYDANMCGKQVESKGLMSWRSNCHTSDEVDGGFHDAGDHAMFGLPQGYTASTLGWAYYEFKDSFDSLGVTDHYKTINDYFAKFFRDATVLSGDSVSKFCIQKGLGDTDHSYWGAPELQGDRGGCDWRSSGAGEIAAEYAAALAASYVNFGNADDLKYAKALYNYAKNNPSCSTGDCQGFYKSDSFNDDLAWAAGWLYKATKEGSYKNDLQSNQKEYIGWAHSWNNVELGAACLLAEETGDWSKVNSYLSGQCSGNGYLCMSEWGSARYNCAMQMTALIASKNSNADYSSWCKNQMTYILGQNPANTCFVTGFASNSAKNTHHRAASGWQGYDGPDGLQKGTKTYHPSKGHVLVGALAGGPADAGGTYSDVIDDYKSNEVALDYNAGLVGAAAGLYSVYKTGSVAASFEGTKSNGVGNAITTPTSAPTTKPTVKPTSTPTSNPTSAPTSSAGGYELKLNQKVDYSALPEDDKMIGWDWADFKIPSSEKITKVDINISSSKTIGKWEGAFGTSTTKSPDYWAQTKDMSQTITGNSGTITWNIDSDISSIIQTQYQGQLKFGIWWIDCGEFTIDSIKVYTNGSGSSTPTSTPTTTPTVKPTSTPTSAPTSAPTSSAGGYQLNINQKVDYSDLPEDDKMIGWDWADFKIPSSEKITKVDINISSSKTIGKWEGAFGTSTTKSPDYWAQTKDMSQTVTGNSGTITWNIDSDISSIIQTQYGGQLKFGIWWIDCGEFTIDSIKVYTEGSSTPTSKPTTTPTVKPTTAPTTTPTASPTTPSDSKVKGDVNDDGTVSTADVVTLLQSLIGKKTLSSNGKANADMNGDNKISILDLILLKNQMLK